jgi:hypothetical protein
MNIHTIPAPRDNVRLLVPQILFIRRMKGCPESTTATKKPGKRPCLQHDYFRWERPDVPSCVQYHRQKRFRTNYDVEILEFWIELLSRSVQRSSNQAAIVAFRKHRHPRCPQSRYRLSFTSRCCKTQSFCLLRRDAEKVQRLVLRLPPNVLHAISCRWRRLPCQSALRHSLVKSAPYKIKRLHCLKEAQKHCVAKKMLNVTITTADLYAPPGLQDLCPRHPPYPLHKAQDLSK